MLARNVILTLFTLSCSISSAQLYETPEMRRKAAEAQLQVEEQKKKADAKQKEEPSLQQKEAEALEYVGRSFSYQPNPTAHKRIRFYERVPSSSHSWEPNDIFVPLTTTSFVVTRLVMAPPLIFPVGKDEYLLEIKFPDGKVGYVNVVGCCGLRENLYKGQRNADKEYVSEEPTDEYSTRRIAARDKAALEQKLIRENSDREKRAAEDKAAKAERASAKMKQERALEEKRREQARLDARAAQMARPSPRIGMTKEQVVSQTNWGGTVNINRTTTVQGTREQWVYGIGRYLYFDNGILTAIQD